MLFSRSDENRKPGLFERMKKALGATKANLVARIETALARRPAIDDALFDELEEVLLGADLGVRATTAILDAVKLQCRQQALKTPAEVRDAIRRRLLDVLSASAGKETPAAGDGLEVWLVVGVNGTGKTTTVGKLAARMAGEGRKVLVCASDTFRPAAIEQLEVWARRAGADLIKSKPGADPSAVLHDALAAAAARGKDVVIVDTAGRLHTRGNLMQELEKMRRVAARLVPGAPHQVLLVIDATTGQNGLQQAREFLKTSGVTGLIVTKLDGTAKGGVLFGIAQELGIPVRYMGVGESVEDLLEFSPEGFIDSLFAE